MFSLIRSFDWWDMKPSDPTKLFKDVQHKRTEESGENEDYEWSSEEWTSEDGRTKYTRKVFRSKPEKVDVAKLEADLKKAVDEQRFEDAIRLRDVLNKQKQG